MSVLRHADEEGRGVSGLRSQGEVNALQVQGAGGVLQRQPQAVRAEGRECGGVESGQQGQEAAGTGEKAGRVMLRIASKVIDREQIRLWRQEMAQRNTKAGTDPVFSETSRGGAA